jgi:hypothetical protein
MMNSQPIRAPSQVGWRNGQDHSDALETPKARDDECGDGVQTAHVSRVNEPSPPTQKVILMNEHQAAFPRRRPHLSLL